MRDMRDVTGVLLIASFLGCVETEVDHATVQPADHEACHAVDERSLIETDPAIVSDARFSLERVFAQIRATTPDRIGIDDIAVPDTRTMFAQLYRAFGTG